MSQTSINHILIRLNEKYSQNFVRVIATQTFILGISMKLTLTSDCLVLIIYIRQKMVLRSEQ